MLSVCLCCRLFPTLVRSSELLCDVFALAVFGSGACLSQVHSGVVAYMYSDSSNGAASHSVPFLSVFALSSSKDGAGFALV